MCVRQPVGDMKIADQRSCLHYPVGNILFPPQRIGINSQPNLMSFIQLAQHIQRLAKTGHTGSLTTYHRVQRFKGKFGVIWACNVISFKQPVDHLAARIINRLPVAPGRRIRPKPASDHHHCARPKAVRTVQHGKQMISAGAQLRGTQGFSDKSTILPDGQRLGLASSLDHRVPDSGALDLRICQNANRAGKITSAGQAHLMNA